VDVGVLGILLVGFIEMAKGRLKIFIFDCLFSGLELRDTEGLLLLVLLVPAAITLPKLKTSPKIRASVIVEYV
jgi:hypothetical protein